MMYIASERLENIVHRYDELLAELSDSHILQQPDRFRAYSQELSELEPVVASIKTYWRLKKEQEEANDLHLSGDDTQQMAELIKEELSSLDEQIAAAERAITDALTERDPDDRRSVIVEIRAGAGGEEAALFSAVLYKMYTAYAQSKGFQVASIDSSPTELGGFKEIVFSIEGEGAYRHFKYESGVHRVQRVPSTESSGRIHTSTVTVAVLPEAKQVDVDIQPSDLRIDVFRASGAGGQHVNRTESAIRITHLPSGIVVSCQDERSQHKNKHKAMAVLMSRLMQIEKEKATGAIADQRKSQVGTGDRSERIRTYNYHQGRVTDHRIGRTFYCLEDMLAGDMDELVEALLAAQNEQQKTGPLS